MSNERQVELERKNKRLAMIVLFVVLLMVGLSFASVPLYNLFCRVTGYGGTTQVSETIPDIVLERKIKVKFTTDISPNLDWDFSADVDAVDVHVGQPAYVV